MGEGCGVRLRGGIPKGEGLGKLMGVGEMNVGLGKVGVCEWQVCGIRVGSGE